jgi:hypothetical protein
MRGFVSVIVLDYSARQSQRPESSRREPRRDESQRKRNVERCGGLGYGGGLDEHDRRNRRSPDVEPELARSEVDEAVIAEVLRKLRLV